MRWRAFFYLNPPNKQKKKETFGFKSTKTPPVIEEMKVFETKITKMIQDIEFTRAHKRLPAESQERHKKRNRQHQSNC